MADVTWTQEQLAAITARNPGILVSAGAGSGKTAVLTERVVQRIFDPVDPVDADRMLIVTFTRAAAEEMRERIAVKLRAVQREHPEDSSVARQLILLEKAAENRMRRMTPREAAGCLFTQLLITRRACALEQALLERTPLWLLQNRGDSAAAELCRDTLSKELTQL